MALFDKPQTANRLNVSPRKLDLLVETGELPAVKIGRRTLFRDVDLERFEANLPAARAGKLVPDMADETDRGQVEVTLSKAIYRDRRQANTPGPETADNANAAT